MKLRFSLGDSFVRVDDMALGAAMLAKVHFEQRRHGGEHSGGGLLWCARVELVNRMDDGDWPSGWVKGNTPPATTGEKEILRLIKSAVLVEANRCKDRIHWAYEVLERSARHDGQLDQILEGMGDA